MTKERRPLTQAGVEPVLRSSIFFPEGEGHRVSEENQKTSIFSVIRDLIEKKP